MSVLYLLLMISGLVIVHEAGHFLAARAVGMPVAIVSLGYGRPWVARTWRQTTYQIGRFPLGGFVRLAGLGGADDEPTAGGPPLVPLWKTLLVIIAGPFANVLLAAIVYTALFAQHGELPAAVIGDVVPDSAAMKAGLLPGDRILAVAGHAVLYWEDVERTVRAAAGREVPVRLLREGREVERLIVVPAATIRRREGGAETRGWLGITHAPFAPMIGVLDLQSPAARAGLVTGDLITNIDGTPTPNWSSVERILARGRRARVTYLRGAELPGAPHVRFMTPGFADVVPATFVNPDLTRTTWTGVEHAELFVARVEPQSPAARAGLRPGDVVVALDDRPITTWRELDQILQSQPNHVWTIRYKRAEGEAVVERSGQLTQATAAVTDVYGHAVATLAFGAHNRSDRTGGAVTPIVRRATYALSNGLSRTAEAVRETARGLWRVLLARGELGGALSIFRAANVSAAQGGAGPWLMLALISVNLGLLNLLPVPTLDGGQVMLSLVEGVRRRPVNAAMRERFQWAGILFIVLVTVLALGNDVRRYF